MTISPAIQFLRLAAGRLQSQQKDAILSFGTVRRRIKHTKGSEIDPVIGLFSRRTHQMEICRALHRYEYLRDAVNEARRTALSPAVTKRTGNVIPN